MKVIYLFICKILNDVLADFCFGFIVFDHHFFLQKTEHLKIAMSRLNCVCYPNFLNYFPNFECHCFSNSNYDFPKSDTNCDLAQNFYMTGCCASYSNFYKYHYCSFDFQNSDRPRFSVPFVHQQSSHFGNRYYVVRYFYRFDCFAMNYYISVRPLCFGLFYNFYLGLHPRFYERLVRFYRFLNFENR